MKLFLRHAALAFVCTTFAAFFIRQVPDRYEVRADLRPTGDLQPSETLSARMERALREAGVETVACEPAGASALRCVAPRPRRGLAEAEREKIERAIQKLGWVSPLALRGRIEVMRAEVSRRLEDIAALENRIYNPPGIDEASAKALQAHEQRRSAIATELDNRQKQLTLIREALVTQPENERPPFAKKETEILEAIRVLEKDRLVLAAEFESIAGLLRAQEELRAQKDESQARLDADLALMTKTDALLEQNLTADRIADPQAFQIPDAGKTLSVHAVHSWGSLPWSVILGFFLYALAFHGWRKRIRGPWPLDAPPPQTPPVPHPKDLEPLLKAPYLGEIELRHAETHEP